MTEETYERWSGLKPEIRDILWRYKRDNDLKKAVAALGDLFDDVWRKAELKGKQNE